MKPLTIGILGGAAALAASIVPMSPVASGAPADVGREMLHSAGDTAQARSSYPGTRGRLNMWQHDGYEGQLDMSSPKLPPHPGSQPEHESLWRLLSYSLRLSFFWCIRPHSEDRDLGNNGFTNLEDEISSLIRMDSNHASHPGREQCREYAAGFLGYEN